jgi:hypothetical protein
MVQLDKVGSRLSAGNGDEAFFDNGTVVGLKKRKVRPEIDVDEES